MVGKDGMRSEMNVGQCAGSHNNFKIGERMQENVRSTPQTLVVLEFSVVQAEHGLSVVRKQSAVSVGSKGVG